MPVSPVQTTYKVEHVDEPMPVSPVQTTYKVEHVDETDARLPGADHI